MSVSSHYRTWAEKNAMSWVLSPGYTHFWAKQIIRRGHLLRDQCLCDLGAGNGTLAKAIKDKTGIAITCIEPEPAMVQKILSLGLTVEQLTGEEFCSSTDSQTYDRLLLKQSLHHMLNKPMEKLFQDFYRILKPCGMGLILIMPSTISYPMFSKAVKRFEENQPDRNAITKYLKNVGFKVEESYADFPVTLSKEHYFGAIRNRFISTLAEFTPNEIEDGLKEIENRYGNAAIYNFLGIAYFVNPPQHVDIY